MSPRKKGSKKKDVDDGGDEMEIVSTNLPGDGEGDEAGVVVEAPAEEEIDATIEEAGAVVEGEATSASEATGLPPPEPRVDLVVEESAETRVEGVAPAETPIEGTPGGGAQGAASGAGERIDGHGQAGHVEQDGASTLQEGHAVAPVTEIGDQTQVVAAVEGGAPDAHDGAGDHAPDTHGADAHAAHAHATDAHGAAHAADAHATDAHGAARGADVHAADAHAAARGADVHAADAHASDAAGAARLATGWNEPADGAPRLAELLERTGRGGLVAVPAEREEAVRLALVEWLGRDLGAAPETVDGRGLPRGLAADAVAQLGQVAAPLGRIVLVAASQREMSIWEPLHSFEEALRDTLFRRLGSTLELLLERQVLVGEVSAHPVEPTAVQHLLGIEDVTVKLDTPGQHLASMERFEESLAKVSAEPDLLLDEERIDGLVARAQEMGASVGDAGNAGVTGPLEVSLEVGSFWTAAFGGVYRLAARPPILVHAAKRDARSEGDDVLRLSDPGLIDRLHASGFLEYDPSLVEQRTRELEEWALLAAGVDPGTMDEAARRRAVAGRARQMPRTWHEMITVRRATQSGPSGARVIHSLSAETKVKLSRPLKDVPVITRLLAELDAIDVPRQFAAASDRFTRDYLGASELARRHMARAILGAVEQAVAPPEPEPEPPPDESDDGEIVFI